MRKSALVVCFVFFFLLLFVCAAAASDLGDINADGGVFAADARLALRFAVGLDTPDESQRLSADADHNGTLTAADARLILRRAVGLEAFTHPFDRSDHRVQTLRAASCTQDGLLLTFCVCGAVREDVIPAPGHTVLSRETPPTCEENGVREAYCSRCGEITETEILPAAGHNDSIISDTPPTCTLAGERIFQCDVCGKTRTEYSPATGHAFPETPVTLLEPTCTEPGLRAKLCTVCGEQSEPEILPAAGHGFVTIQTAAPTCGATGLTVRVCAVCGQREEIVLPALGAHTFKLTAADVSDCEAGGAQIYTCAVCGAEKTEPVEPAPHRFQTVVAREPDCVTGGETVRQCEICGKTEREPIPARGHRQIPALEKDAAATCTAPGVAGFICADCGADLSVPISPAGHVPQTVPAIEPTCTQPGRSESAVCAVCGETLAAAAALEPLGHRFTAWAPDPETGVLTRSCGICGETERKDAACEHVFTQTSITQPSCEAPGERTLSCALCGAERRELLPPTGHSYQPETVDPTCTEQGFTVYTCAFCGKSYESDFIPASGHIKSLINAAAVSCEQAGYTGDTVCRVCGLTLSVGAEIPAPGHAPGEPAAEREASCTESGETVLRCLVCGAEIAREIIPPRGHGIAIRYENGGAVRVSYCGICGEILQTELLTAVKIDASGEQTDVFSLEDALENALPGDTVVLLRDASLSRNAQIPQGVTLVVPCFPGDTGFGPDGTPPDGAVRENGDTKTLFRTLTVPEGVTLTVRGMLLVNAQTGRNTGEAGTDQNVSGGYGELLLSGGVIVKQGGLFYCAGFVNRREESGGEVILEPGAELKETLCVPRFRGLTYSLACAAAGINPIPIPEADAMRAKLTVHAGASLTGIVKFYAAAPFEEARLHASSFSLAGETGLIRLHPGASLQREIRGDGAARSAVYRLCGGADSGSAVFTFFQGSQIETGTLLFSVSGSVRIELYDGAYELDHSFLLLPGGSLTVGENAVLTVSENAALVLAGDGFYEKDALLGALAYPAGRAPASLSVCSGGSVSVFGVLAGKKTGTVVYAASASDSYTVFVPTSLSVRTAEKEQYAVEIC